MLEAAIEPVENCLDGEAGAEGPGAGASEHDDANRRVGGYALEVRAQHRNVVGIDPVVLAWTLEADRRNSVFDRQARRPISRAFPRRHCLVSQRPTIARTSDLRKRSTTSMNPIDGISNSKAVIDEIW